MMKRIGYLFLFCMISYTAFAQQSGYNYVSISHNNGMSVGDIMTVKPNCWRNLCEINEHPGFEINFTPEIKDSLLCEINKINKGYPKDTLLSPDLFYIFKPYFMWLRDMDPHYRVRPGFVVNSAEYRNVKQYHKDVNRKITYLPFNCLNINDTLLVNTSLDNLFKRGDIILSINGIDVKDILKYNYPDRLTSPTSLLANYYQRGMTSSYNLTINRNGKIMDIESPGWSSYNDVRVELLQSMATEVSQYVNGGIGYVAIPEFFSDNSRLIKILKKTILSFKEQGINSVILDLRDNPGGYGDRFDELLSLFIDKNSIPYLRSAKAKLTEKNIKYYSQPSSNIGKYYAFSNDELISDITLKQTDYIKGIKYYILMNQGTGSIAASFCNIMQYNKAAVLLGEPLLRNALKYGESITYPERYPNSSIPAIFQESSVSSVEFDEYSNAIDGILHPDYQIICNAIEYCSGQDPVIVKAVDYARNRQ